MKCLNPECSSMRANELNVSLNVSETEEGMREDDPTRPEYSGTTDYGNTSNIVGTVCPDCELQTFAHNWRDIMIEWLRPNTRHDFVVVLPEPRWCAACLEESEKQSHADYADKWASKWDASALMCKDHALKHALKGEPIVLWEELTA